MGIVFLSSDEKVWKLHEYNGGIVNVLNANKSITVEKLLCCMNLTSAATSRTKFKHTVFQKIEDQTRITSEKSLQMLVKPTMWPEPPQRKTGDKQVDNPKRVFSRGLSNQSDGEEELGLEKLKIRGALRLANMTGNPSISCAGQ